MKRKFFHTQPRMSKRDIGVLKARMEFLRQKKLREELENRRKRKLRGFRYRR